MLTGSTQVLAAGFSEADLRGHGQGDSFFQNEAMDIVIVLIKIILALVWFLILTLYLTWVERKESAVIQDRIGANRASIFGLRLFGLFQPFADAIKMIFKEDFVPAFSRKFLHTLAPFLSFFFVAVTIAAIPFGDEIRIGGPDDQPPDLRRQRRPAFRPGHALPGNLRHHPQRLGLEQPVRPPRRDPRARPSSSPTRWRSGCRSSA